MMQLPIGHHGTGEEEDAIPEDDLDIVHRHHQEEDGKHVEWKQDTEVLVTAVRELKQFV